VPTVPSLLQRDGHAAGGRRLVDNYDGAAEEAPPDLTEALLRWSVAVREKADGAPDSPGVAYARPLCVRGPRNTGGYGATR
jgi:hypothetical protein